MSSLNHTLTPIGSKTRASEVISGLMNYVGNKTNRPQFYFGVNWRLVMDAYRHFKAKTPFFDVFRNNKELLVFQVQGVS